jgi:uncharacterized protein YktA (UPF0223 family)
MANGDKQFSYPMLDGWTTADIIAVSQFYSAVAAAYETGVDVVTLKDAYRDFKNVVPSKAEEKQLDKAFGAESGYSLYKTMQAANQVSDKRLTMEGYR